MSTKPPPAAIGLRERFQWGSYGFVPGLLLGILLGWIFSGVVSWVFRFGLALLILIPLVLIFFAWRWFTIRDDETKVVMYEYRAPLANQRDNPDSIEANARVVDSRVNDAARVNDAER